MGMLDGWTSCPRCRADLVRERGLVRCPSCGLVVWANPAASVGALVVHPDGRVLLGRRAREPAAGRWDILGGFMDEWEQPLETLRRELREETGVEVEPLDFLGVVSDRYGPDGYGTVNLAWTARIVSGEPRPGDDVTELRWFARDELPADDELAFGNTAQLLALWRSG